MVRYVGMVQDMLESTYIPMRQNMECEMSSSDPVRSIHSSLRQRHEEQHHQLLEQTPFLLTPVAGTTPWFRGMVMGQDGDYDSDHGDDAEHRDKRIRVEYDVGMETAHDTRTTTSLLDSNEPSVVAQFYFEQYHGMTPAPPKVLLNEVIEIFGVLLPPTGGDDDTDIDEDVEETIGSETQFVSGIVDHQRGTVRMLCDDDDDRALQQDQVQLPEGTRHVQVLWYRILELEVPVPPAQPIYQSVQQTIPSYSSIAKALGIDPVAAESLWMAILSLAERSVTHPDAIPVRTPHETVLGCASLNMILPSIAACGEFQSRLEQVLSSILPVVWSYNITPSTLRHLAVPRKVDGRLQPTPLQLPKGATVIWNISEFVHAAPLAPGQLDTLRGLQLITQSHHMSYHFEGGCTILFEADVRVIVLSTTTTHKLLPCTLRVHCYPETEITPIPESDLKCLRRQLALSRRGNVLLPPVVLERSQHDFVARRAAYQQGEESRQQLLHHLPEEMDFHRWLTLTRLQARSHGRNEARVDDWEQALRLDNRMFASAQ